MKDYINKIIQGNCLDVLRTLEDESVDGIVTDPPYELGFMGKKWDSSGIAYKVEMWKQCLRVLKPGGYLLAFSSARTYHRMAVAIEDAGFEIRDMVEWIYSSGFPKSINIGKAYDKQWAITVGTSEYEGVGSALKPAHEPICLARKPLSEPTILNNVIKHGVGGLSIDDCRIPVNLDNEPRDYSKEDHVKNEHIYSEGQGVTWKYQKRNLGQSIKEQYTKGRFPANVIVTDDALNDGTVTTSSGGDGSKFKESIFDTTKNNTIKTGKHGLGLGDSGSKSRYFDVDAWNEKVWAEHYGLLQYPKASKSERNKGCEKLEEKKTGHGNLQNSVGFERFDTSNKNHHPTVKPISVMSWLIRLISRPGMVILDPFTGSGSTPVACILNGRQYIGIELTEEYLPIIDARIKQAEEDAKFILNGKNPVKNDIKTGLNPFRYDKEHGSLF